VAISPTRAPAAASQTVTAPGRKNRSAHVRHNPSPSEDVHIGDLEAAFP